MIKTGKPIGHFWTNKSVFQESKAYWHIRYEDCTPPSKETLVPDSEHYFATAKRAAKRRRIERLAHDFLEGKPLNIKSARPDPTLLKALVIRHLESTASQTLLDGPISRQRLSRELTWAEVDDVWDVLRKRKAQRRRAKRQLIEAAAPKQGSSCSIVVVESASSKLSPVLQQGTRRTRAPKLLLRPSEEALQQAAALRARKVQADRTGRHEIDESSKKNKTPSEQVQQSTWWEADSFQPAVKTRSHAPKANQWLNRTGSPDLRAEDSADELGCSTEETPSRKSRASSSASRAGREQIASAENRGTSESPGVTSLDRHGRRLPPTRLYAILPSQSAALAHSPQGGRYIQAEVAPIYPGAMTNGNAISSTHGAAPYHVMPEESLLGPFGAPVSTTGDSQDGDSQTRLLRTQGIHAAPRKSWASLNDAATAMVEDHIPIDHAGREVGRSIPTLRAALQQSAGNAGTVNKGRRKTSSRRSDPPVLRRCSRGHLPPANSPTAMGQKLDTKSESNVAAPTVQSARHSYTTRLSTGNSATPFVFRKRGSRQHVPNNETRAAIHTAVERGMSSGPASPESDIHVINLASASDKQLAPVATTPPVLDMSFEHDSSFAPKLNMALVQEHLNSILPSEPGPAGRSSSVRAAIQSELRSAGAIISRAPAELDFHLAEDIDQTAPGDVSTGEYYEPDQIYDRPRTAPSQFWPGTQVLLNKAQHELLISPEKQNSGGCQKATTASLARKPLKQLSQEPLPATQALMDCWSPWSTVKKPHNPKRSAPTPQPRSVSTAPNPELTTSAKGKPAVMKPNERHNGTAARRSSLRFSLPTTDAPLMDLSLPVPPPRNSLLQRSFPAQSPMGPAEVVTHSRSVAEHQDASCEGPNNLDPPSAYQAAQLLRDDSNPERTLNELASDLLCTTDLNGVLSQTNKLDTL